MYQPVVQRRRQQQDLTRVERPEGLVHRRWTCLWPLHLDRLRLEQPIPTTLSGIVSHGRPREAGGLLRVVSLLAGEPLPCGLAGDPESFADLDPGDSAPAQFLHPRAQVGLGLVDVRGDARNDTAPRYRR